MSPPPLVTHHKIVQARPIHFRQLILANVTNSVDNVLATLPVIRFSLTRIQEFGNSEPKNHGADLLHEGFDFIRPSQR